MTDGPYQGSIRDNTNSGLQGLFTQLALIVAGLGALPQLAIDIAAIRVVLERDLPLLVTRVGWIAGTTAPSAFNFGTSFRDYFQTVIGNRQTAEQQDTLLGAAIGTAGYLVRLENILYGVQLGRPDEANSRIAALVADLDALTLVMGLAADAPIGSTIKALLASIDVNALRSADCCEEGLPPPVDPANPLNPAPAAFGCPNPVRVASWKLLVTQTTPQQNTETIWQAIFSPPPGMVGQAGTSDAERRGYRLGAALTKYDICISWDFTSNAMIPLEFGRNRASTVSGAVDTNSVGAPSLGGASTLTTGGLTDELSSCIANDPGNDIIAYTFRFGGTAVPPLNAFISTVVRSCAV